MGVRVGRPHDLKGAFDMQRVIKFGAVLVAVFAIGAAVAAGASAHDFEASQAGAPLLVRNDAGPQVFSTLAGTLECATLKGSGTTKSLTYVLQRVTVSYEGCKFTNGVLTAKADEPINAEYNFNANGTVVIETPITILSTIVGIKCSVTVLEQGSLGVVTYKNKPTKAVLVETNLAGLETSAVGGGCKETYKSSTSGTYSGNALIEAEEGGEFAWV
jgi:hypothetical protein